MCYFSNAFARPQITVDAICHALNDPKFDRVDFIVGTGVSGTLMLIPVSLKSGIPCGAVRKSLDTFASFRDGGSHSDRGVETYMPSGRHINQYIIIDDLIDSGETIKKVIQAMTKKYAHSKCVGIILYQNYASMKDDDWDGIPLTRLLYDVMEVEGLRRQEGVLA